MEPTCEGPLIVLFLVGFQALQKHWNSTDMWIQQNEYISGTGRTFNNGIACKCILNIDWVFKVSSLYSFLHPIFPASFSLFFTRFVTGLVSVHCTTGRPGLQSDLLKEIERSNWNILFDMKAMCLLFVISCVSRAGLKPFWLSFFLGMKKTGYDVRFPDGGGLDPSMKLGHVFKQDGVWKASNIR